MRADPDAPLEGILVLNTLGAPERHWLRDRRPRELEEAAPEPVPTSRATIVRPEAFKGEDEAAAWLGSLRRDVDALDGELERGLRLLNRGLRAQRAAAADPSVAEVSASRALVARVGYGKGEKVADGLFGEALELPRAGARTVKRSMEAPEERFAALLGGRRQALVAEELVLRARTDLDAGRPREAALQARVAIEALLAELPDETVAAHRELVRQAAGAALTGDPPHELEPAVTAMEAALRRRRLEG